MPNSVFRPRLLLVSIAIVGLCASAARADTLFLQPSVAAAPEMLFGIDAGGLSDQIKQALAEETGFPNLQSVTVHWDGPTFRCLIKTYELHDVEHGVCLVEVSAFQVMATALIIKNQKSDAFEVSILSARIE